jgi:hypothetical protein
MSKQRDELIHLGGIPPFDYTHRPTPPITPDEAARLLKTIIKAVGYDYANLFVLWVITTQPWGKEKWDLIVGGALNHKDTDDDLKYTPFDGFPDVAFFVRNAAKRLQGAQGLPPVFADTLGRLIFPIIRKPLLKGAAGGSSSCLPQPTAALFTSAFIKGFATRLILGGFATHWNVKVALPSSTESMIQLQLSNLTKAVLSPVPTWQGTDWPNLLFNLTDSHLQVTAIMHGWRAGDLLMADPNNKDAKDAIKAFWDLCKKTYTMRQLGMFAGYVFEFLIGALQCERISDAILHGKPFGNAVADANKIFHDNWAPHHRNRQTAIGNSDDTDKPDGKKQPSISNLSRQFSAYILEHLVVLAKKGSPDDDHTKSYATFIWGYLHGISQSAEELFKDMFVEAYTVGYAIGFSTGYAQGYAAGYQAGYAQGEADATTVWKEIQNVLTTTNDFITDVKTVQGVINDGATFYALLVLL